MTFNLLLRRECCTFSNGEYVKSGLAELELWCCQAKEEAQLGMNSNTLGKPSGSWATNGATEMDDTDRATSRVAQLI
ncbi:hypothetical protein ACS0TY_019086 [Phlomoides rotata]